MSVDALGGSSLIAFVTWNCVVVVQVFSQKPQRKFGAAIAGNGFQPGRPSSRAATLPSQTYCTLWSSPNISHLNRFLSLQCLICLSSCDFAHQSGGSSPSSSLYYICGVAVFVGLPVVQLNLRTQTPDTFRFSSYCGWLGRRTGPDWAAREERRSAMPGSGTTASRTNTPSRNITCLQSIT